MLDDSDGPQSRNKAESRNVYFGYRCSRSFVNASARAESPAKGNADAASYCASSHARSSARPPLYSELRLHSRIAVRGVMCAEPRGGSLPKRLAPPATTSLWSASDAPKMPRLARALPRSSPESRTFPRTRCPLGPSPLRSLAQMRLDSESSENGQGWVRINL
jgi:hypothetical protein